MEQKQPQKKKLHIRAWSAALLAVSAGLAVCLCAAVIYGTVCYKNMRAAADGFTEAGQWCDLFSLGSQTLTRNARAYVSTGERKFLKDFFEELNVTRRREEALAGMEQTDQAQALALLRAAMEDSETLMSREEYAIRLAASALEEDVTQLPIALQSVELRAEDQTLSSAEKLQAARALLYTEEYEAVRASLDSRLAETRAALRETAGGALQGAGTAMRGTAAVLCVLAVLLVLVTAAALGLLAVLVAKPLHVYLRCVREEKLLQFAEVFTLGSVDIAYEDVFAMESANCLMLEPQQQHDALTGLIAHEAFAGLQRLLASRTAPMALLVADIEGFREVNEAQGREVGDRLLQRVAKLLTLSFRSTDYVVRLSGDEFAVVLTDMPAACRNIVTRKIEEINGELQSGRDGLPPVRLSVGVAFSPAGFAEDLYQKADLALYAVKESGRSDCCVYTASDM